MKVSVNIPRPDNKLLSRSEILLKDGIYKDPQVDETRFVVTGGHCIIVGDNNPFYISGNHDMFTPRYVKTDERMVISFQ